MNSLWQDLRYALHMLIKQPGFTLAAILTLGLGIGANSAIFSVFNAVLLQPLPYEQPDRLMQLNRLNTLTKRVSPLTSPLNFRDWRSRNQSFEQLGGYLDNESFNLSSDTEPERIVGARVSDTLLPALGARPQVGRNFLPEEDRQGGDRVVILSHSLWTRRFGADPQVLGQVLMLNGSAHTIVGVMPAQFDFPNNKTDVWVPFGATYEDAGRGNFFVQVVGKLKPNVTQAQAQTEMQNVAAALEHEYPAVNTNASITLTPLHEQLTGKIRPLLWLLLSAVGLVLLIACVNVANLLLARAAERQRELAIRSALGASRWRIMRQLLSESLLLALFGGALGLLLAYWSVPALLAISPEDLPRLTEIHVDGRVFGFTFVTALLTGWLFGLAPAWHASNPNLNEMLKEGGRNAGGSSSGLRSTLVIAEVALSLVLLICAGLLMRSFWHVLAVNPGFNPEHVLTFEVSLPHPKYDREKRKLFFQQALARLAALPTVQTVGATSVLPLSQGQNARIFTVEGRQENNPRDFTIESHRYVSQRYFETLGIPLRVGRQFDTADFNAAAAPVVILNQAFARAYFPKQEAVGKRIKMGQTAESPFPWMTVVGVVGDVKHTSLEAEPRPEMYRPFMQLTTGENEPQMTFALRSTQPAEALLAAARREIQALDAAQPLANVATLERLLEKSVARRRFALSLLGIFAFTALVLAVIGIYSVMSYTVAQSTRELGIRVALGAQTHDILKLVVGQGFVLVMLGMVLGLASALALTRLLAGLLYEVTATDPLAFGSVALLLLGVALLACLIPAWQATRVDPLVALKCE